ncbi:MAG: hypothetical protein ACRD82_16855, partial [Blastocatellia bacterium]
MIQYTLDTSAIITYKVKVLPKNFLASGVVLSELIASANDDSARKLYETIRHRHAENGSLIVPTGEDWLLASRVLFWLTRRRKKSAGGQLPPQQTGAAQRMMMDALIAVSARRVGATVITDDWEDFKSIQYYCKVKLVRGSEYFN